MREGRKPRKQGPSNDVALFFYSRPLGRAWHAMMPVVQTQADIASIYLITTYNLTTVTSAKPPSQGKHGSEIAVEMLTIEEFVITVEMMTYPLPPHCPEGMNKT